MRWGSWSCRGWRAGAARAPRAPALRARRGAPVGARRGGDRAPSGPRRVAGIVTSLPGWPRPWPAQAPRSCADRPAAIDPWRTSPTPCSVRSPTTRRRCQGRWPSSATGFHGELDALRAIRRDGRSYIASLDTRERTDTGSPPSRFRYNKGFGYYIEVSKANLHLCPSASAASRRSPAASATSPTSCTTTRTRSSTPRSASTPWSTTYSWPCARRWRLARRASSARRGRWRSSTCWPPTRNRQRDGATAARGWTAGRKCSCAAGAIRWWSARCPSAASCQASTDTADKSMATSPAPNMGGESTYLRRSPARAHGRPAELQLLPAEEATVGVPTASLPRGGLRQPGGRPAHLHGGDNGDANILLRPAPPVLLDEIGLDSTLTAVHRMGGVEHLHRARAVPRNLFATHSTS